MSYTAIRRVNVGDMTYFPGQTIEEIPIRQALRLLASGGISFGGGSGQASARENYWLDLSGIDAEDTWVPLTQPTIDENTWYAEGDAIEPEEAVDETTRLAITAPGQYQVRVSVATLDDLSAVTDGYIKVGIMGGAPLEWVTPLTSFKAVNPGNVPNTIFNGTVTLLPGDELAIYVMSTTEFTMSSPSSWVDIWRTA